MKKLMLFVFCLMAHGSIRALPRDVADAISDNRHAVIVYVCSDPDQLGHEMKNYPMYFHKEDNSLKSALIACSLTTVLNIAATYAIVYYLNK